MWACISLNGPSVRDGGMGAPIIILSHREFKQFNINARTPSINKYFLTIILTIFARKNISSKLTNSGSYPFYLQSDASVRIGQVLYSLGGRVGKN